MSPAPARTGSPGTTDDSVAAARRSDLGIHVVGERTDSYADHLDHVRTILATKPDLLVDNGADLIEGVLARGGHDVAAAQLAPAPLLGLAVDGHLAGGEQLLGVGARARDAGKLQQLAEADDVVADLDVAHRASRPWAAGGRGSA